MEFYAYDRATYEKFADGKVKDISEEIPFELAQGWAWTRIGAVFYLQAGKNISSQCIKEHSAGYPYPCYGGNGVRGYVKKSSHKGIHAVIGRQGALCGNLNLTHDEFYATEHAVVVETFSEVTADFAYWFLKQMNLNQYATATAQPGLSVREIVDVMFPLPPLAEQKRIAAEIEELFAHADKIGDAADGISQAAARINKKILGLAIRGQLVPQDPNDEPASELIKRIEAAKKATAKGRKSSRIAASDRPAYETEAPFDIPDSWEWARLGDVATVIGGSTPPQCALVSYGTPYFKVAEMNLPGNEKFLRYTSFFVSPSFKIRRFPSATIVFPKNGGALLTNKKRILVSESVCDLNTGGIVLAERQMAEYVYLWFCSIDLQRFLMGGIIPTISATVLRNLMLPIPPLAEQKRIVTKIEELRAMTRSLTK